MNIRIIQKNSKISPQDRGLLYGDGFFTTCRIAKAWPVCWEEHRHRLRFSARQLKFPPIDFSKLEQALGNLPETGALKIVITRGEGERGYAIPQPTKSECLIFISTLPVLAAKNQLQHYSLAVCDTPISINPVLAGVKHLNKLDLVLARNELAGSTFQEGLMHSRGTLYCATQANVFFTQGKTLITPLLNTAGVRGVMRAQVLKWAAAMNYSCHESKVSLTDMQDFDECFLTSCLHGVVAVRRIAIDQNREVDYKHHTFAKQFYRRFLSLV